MVTVAIWILFKGEFGMCYSRLLSCSAETGAKAIMSVPVYSDHGNLLATSSFRVRSSFGSAS